MGTRHEAREKAVQFLFQRDHNQGDLETALEYFWAGQNLSLRARTFTEKLVRGVEERRDEIDAEIQRCAEHWDIKRMGSVDRNVMRVALFEMMFCPDIPPIVSINEAVDLAKVLSSYESGRFVNGILDRALKDMDNAQPSNEKKRG